MPKRKDLTLAVLREIRDEIRSTRDELRSTREELSSRIDGTNTRLDHLTARVGAVEHGLLDLAEQQRFIVRRLVARTSRDRRVDTELATLRLRIDALEQRSPSR